MNKDDLWETLAEYPEARKALLEKVCGVVVKVFKKIVHSIYGDFMNDEI